MAGRRDRGREPGQAPRAVVGDRPRGVGGVARARAGGPRAQRTGNPYKPAALRGYERSMRLRVLPAFGHVKLSKVTRAEVQTFADRLTDEGLSASTCRTRSNRCASCSAAMRRDLVAVDPNDGVGLRRSAASVTGSRPRGGGAGGGAGQRGPGAVGDRVLRRAAARRAARAALVRVDLDGATIGVAREWDDQEGELDEAKSEAGTRTLPVLDVLARELAPTGCARPPGRRLVFGRSDAEPFIPTTVRSRALAAWARENAAAWRLRAEGRAAGADVAALGRQTARGVIAAGANPKVVQTSWATRPSA